MQVIKNSWAGLGEQEGRQEVKIEWDIRENRPSNKKNKMKKAKRNDLQIYGYVLQLNCAYMCLNFFVLCLSYGVIIVPVMFSFCSCGSIWLLVPVCLFTVLVFMLSNVSLPILSLVFFLIFLVTWLFSCLWSIHSVIMLSRFPGSTSSGELLLGPSHQRCKLTKRRRDRCSSKDIYCVMKS